MKCPNCAVYGMNIEMEEATTEYFTSKGSHYFIIEETPCLKCSTCGEIYFKLSTLEHIERFTAELEGREEKVILANYTQGPEAA